MALEYKTVLDTITICRDGSMNVRLGLLIVDGAEEVNCNWHRYGVAPGEDPSAYLAEVTNDIATKGYPPVDQQGMWMLTAAAAVRDAGQQEEVK